MCSNSTFTLQSCIDAFIPTDISKRVSFCESCKPGTSCTSSVSGLLPMGLVSARESRYFRACFWLTTHIGAGHLLSQFILPPALVLGKKRGIAMARGKRSAAEGSWAVTARWWPPIRSFLKNFSLWHPPLSFSFSIGIPELYMFQIQLQHLRDEY